MLDTILDAFAPESLSATTLWGLFIRIYGALFVFATAMLVRQIVPLAGERGLVPLRGRLDRIRADYPNKAERWLRYPTLHWFASSDAALKWMLAGSAAIGFVCTVLGAHTRVGFFVLWAVYLSYANTMGFYFPWDCLLLESGFLSLFLPTLPSPFALGLAEMPAPLLTFSFRYLVFRLMFGFGKFKFIGASLKEFSYLRGFMINQPMPSIFGRLMYHLPLPVHVLNLAVFFVSEIICPFFFFATGSWRIAAGLTTMHLMFAIHLTGNFGFFNLLTCILCMPLLDGVDTLFAREGLFQMVFAQGTANMALHLVLVFLLIVSIIFFPFNSWCTTSFFYWPAISLPVNPIGRLLRLLAPFRLVHAYGVFFPHSLAGVRWIPVIEGTSDPRANDLTDEEDDESHIAWQQYEYAFMTTRTDRMPPFCAPWHERVDQAILYESIGSTPETYLSSLTSGNRYDFNPLRGGSMLQRVCAGLMQGNREIEGLFRHNPFPPSSFNSTSKSKLQGLRISLYMYAPTSFRDVVTKRVYWDRRYVGRHAPTITRRMVDASLAEYAATAYTKDTYGAVMVREPEMGHPEHYILHADAPCARDMHVRIDRAVAKGKVDANEILATGPTSAPANLVQPITSAHLDHEFWSPTSGFLARLQPLLERVRVPVPLSMPQLDFEHHLQPGEWSKIITTALRSPATHPLAGKTATEVHRLEKIAARGTLALLYRLLPLYHGPGADEMMTTAQIKAAGGKKRGAYSLHPCKRDACQVREHLHLPSFFHLYLFTQHLMAQGRAVVEAVLLEPSQALKHLPTYTLASGLVWQAVFHPTMLAFHAAKIRMVMAIGFEYQFEHGGILPGFLSINYNWLAREYRTKEEGALSPHGMHLPKITHPKRYDEVWIVEYDGVMPLRDAPGLATEESDRSDKQAKRT